MDGSRSELFEARVRRWGPDLLAGVQAVYGERAEQTAGRLLELARAGAAQREPELARLDLDRMLRPDWFQDSALVGYAAYVDRFAGTLDGLKERIPYLQELGVSYLHLMPLLATREGPNDGGYAVADYRAVRSDLGDTEALQRLTAALRQAGISTALDLVLNHVAREHPWAVAARAGDPIYQAYFHIYPDRTVPDAYEETLLEVFPDFAPGSFSWDDELNAWVWTTFNSYQWDLRWSNPDVLIEFAELIVYLANLGVEVLRLDAIPFLWKRLGTQCQNEPEVHSITQILRAVARIVCPAVAFKAEAIVAPSELARYLGRGPHQGKVSDLAYHNTLMVQIWSMLATGEVALTAQALHALPPVPSTTAWITYLRGHDDIGWAISDEDAAAVGLSGPAHRSFLSDWYAGEFPGSSARGLVFQANAATGDRRISGTAASLAGADVDPGLLRRVMLGYEIVFGWGGIPVIWSGDELAESNDPDWWREPGHEADNRWANRPRLDWSRANRRHQQGSAAAYMFEGLAQLAALRRDLPHLDASVASQIPDVRHPGVLPVLREHPTGVMLQLYNVTASACPWPGADLNGWGLTEATELLTGVSLVPDEGGNLWIPPYTGWWIVAAKR